MCRFYSLLNGITLCRTSPDVSWVNEVLISIFLQQCNSQGVTIVSPPKSEYPWSPRWEASAMAERILWVSPITSLQSSLYSFYHIISHWIYLAVNFLLTSVWVSKSTVLIWRLNRYMMMLSSMILVWYHSSFEVGHKYLVYDNFWLLTWIHAWM